MPKALAPPPRGRPLRGADCGRATLRRVLWIHERLGNGLAATAVSLARELETSERSVKRDIEFMRDQLGAPTPAVHPVRVRFFSRDVFGARPPLLSRPVRFWSRGASR